MKAMRVIVTGSRDWKDRATVHDALDELAHAARSVGERLIVAGCPMSDPGHAGGAQVYVIHPKCLCGDAWVMHKPNDAGVRGACSHSGCGCRVYRATTEAADA